MRALSVDEVAAELGRSVDWLHRHWRGMVDEKKLPPPLPGGGALAWSAAQLYAVLDKPLTREQRALAAAFRAAEAVARQAGGGLDDQDEIEASRARITARFARG